MIAFTRYSEKPFAISTVMEGGIASSVRLTTASIRTGPSSANALAIPSSTSDGSFGRLPRIPTASDHMRLGPGGEGGNLLVPDMQPLGFALPADCIGQAIQAVADDAADTLDACDRKGLSELARDAFHNLGPWCRRSTVALSGLLTKRRHDYSGRIQITILHLRRLALNLSTQAE